MATWYQWLYGTKKTANELVADIKFNAGTISREVNRTIKKAENELIQKTREAKASLANGGNITVKATQIIQLDRNILSLQQKQLKIQTMVDIIEKSSMEEDISALSLQFGDVLARLTNQIELGDFQALMDGISDDIKVVDAKGTVSDAVFRPDGCDETRSIVSTDSAVLDLIERLKDENTPFKSPPELSQLTIPDAPFRRRPVKNTGSREKVGLGVVSDMAGDSIDTLAPIALKTKDPPQLTLEARLKQLKQ